MSDISSVVEFCVSTNLWNFVKISVLVGTRNLCVDRDTNEQGTFHADRMWSLLPWAYDEIYKVYRRLMVDLFTAGRN